MVAVALTAAFFLEHWLDEPYSQNRIFLDKRHRRLENILVMIAPARVSHYQLVQIGERRFLSLKLFKIVHVVMGLAAGIKAAGCLMQRPAHAHHAPDAEDSSKYPHPCEQRQVHDPKKGAIGEVAAIRPVLWRNKIDWIGLQESIYCLDEAIRDCYIRVYENKIVAVRRFSAGIPSRAWAAMRRLY